jgi:hypothetical protein
MSTVFLGVALGGILLLGFSLVFALLSWRRSVRLGEEKVNWWANWQQGMSTEMSGALVATIVFGLAIGYLEERDTKDELQREHIRAQLIYDMGSLDNAEALHAVERLRAQGWLTNRTLKDKQFVGANLRGADLATAYLRGAWFVNADLEGVDLSGTNLMGAIFTGANLQNARLDGAEYDEKTVLPDGTPWSTGADLARFTDPDHPDFWRAPDPGQPPG